MSMTLNEARSIAAQAWCDPPTQHLEMNTDLCDAFALILKHESDKRDHPITGAIVTVAHALRTDPQYRAHLKLKLKSAKIDAVFLSDEILEGLLSSLESP